VPRSAAPAVLCSLPRADLPFALTCLDRGTILHANTVRLVPLLTCGAVPNTDPVHPDLAGRPGRDVPLGVTVKPTVGRPGGRTRDADGAPCVET
jgi:hypothetical protein